MNNTNLIIGATLLSVEEAKQIPLNILGFGGWWWLRSPGYFTGNAAVVDGDGVVRERGDSVDDDNDSVRPALHLYLEPSDPMSDGTKLRIGKYGFIIVCNGKYALCDTPIGKSAFRKDWDAEDANDYEASDVKKVVDDWFENEIKGIDVEMATYTKIGIA